MNDEYTTVEDIENYTLIDVAAEYEGVIDMYIQAMSNFIDNYCNRKIWTDQETTIKYDGDGTNLLVIKDVCDISEVTVDDEVTEVLEYPTSKDYTSRIVLDGGYRFTKGLQNVAVTGKHAMHTELPEDIKFACTVLVAGIIFNQDANEKDGTTEKIGNYSISYKTPEQKRDYKTAMGILSSYRRIAL